MPKTINFECSKINYSPELGSRLRNERRGAGEGGGEDGDLHLASISTDYYWK